MKTLPILLALGVLAAAPLSIRAADHACCHAAAPAAAAPVSDRSLYQLGATWTDDAGQAVTLAEFRGEPVVLAMFFASCTYACPILVHDVQAIRAALPADVRAKARFILISFDTERDTVAALRAYREKQGLDDHWTLLRGSADDVQELAMLLGVKYRREASGDYSHSNLVTVLNREGEIAHQREGLQGEVAPTAHAITLAAK
jgi:protein SCO1/2